ncbi:DNA topoisomerase 1 [Seminavis robusta]|uniref:DNA topoisomerase 1 n=1 Tax=Seminavis robusta TaxID=568900 RepID=A0A9N8EFM0_9STRA|nr:DNA topoisomerase 1 [Seminavis robusta]|eukprot:Sro1053_g235820.1 DNA topoisomerase 1 (735) ;mRNA; r:3479-6410
MADDSEEEFTMEDNEKKKKKPKLKVKLSKSSAKPDAASSSSSKRKKSGDNGAKPAAKKAKTNGGKPKKGALKELDKTERLAFAMQSFLWWDADEPPPGCQWRTMEHAGVAFPETYEPHGIKMKYDGKEVDLTPAQEEAATFFAAMDPDGMHLGNPKTAKIFIRNFFDDFKTVLGKKHVIKSFDKCDFEPIRQHLNEQKIIRKAISDQEKKANKEDRNKVMFKFGYSLVDGHIEKVGNYNMEPPGAFRGRGEHPKMGKLKSRVLPEQVSLNVSQCAAVPICPVPGHAWKDVRHDPRGQWLATWKENINNQSKYMQLAAQSSFKGKSDRSKYNKAALLCKNIDKIRKSYKKDLKSKDKETKQLATATWVIDRLALRVGGEKDTDEEADTVGCCSLRVEHLHIDPNEEGGDNKEIELEFLGKDSMLFKQTIDFGSQLYNENSGMGSQVYENLKKFCKGKKKTEEIFDSINPTMLNNHLKQFMDGLSAKVFRTYNASKTLQEELRKKEKLAGWSRLSPAEKVIEYNNANREVAILCNHQRSVSKAQETQLENISNKIDTLKKQKKMLKGILKFLNSGKDNKKIPLKKSQASMKEDVDKALAKAKKMKDKASTNEEKIAATQADEKAKEMRRELADFKFTQAHLWERVPSKDQVIKRIETWNGKISKMEMDLKHKDDNKEVSLGTSKINYMDPRITVAWCKRNEVPIERVFSKTLRDKFNWAMAVPPAWEFSAEIGLMG